jgi:hypothetical protein
MSWLFYGMLDNMVADGMASMVIFDGLSDPLNRVILIAIIFRLLIDVGQKFSMKLTGWRRLCIALGCYISLSDV